MIFSTLDTSIRILLTDSAALLCDMLTSIAATTRRSSLSRRNAVTFVIQCFYIDPVQFRVNIDQFELCYLWCVSCTTFSDTCLLLPNCRLRRPTPSGPRITTRTSSYCHIHYLHGWLSDSNCSDERAINVCFDTDALTTRRPKVSDLHLLDILVLTSADQSLSEQTYNVLGTLKQMNCLTSFEYVCTYLVTLCNKSLCSNSDVDGGGKGVSHHLVQRELSISLYSVVSAASRNTSASSAFSSYSKSRWPFPGPAQGVATLGVSNFVTSIKALTCVGSLPIRIQLCM